MKNLLIINTVANTGSTGRIAEEIGLLANSEGFESQLAYGQKAVNSQLPVIKIGNKTDFYIHALETRLYDNHGFSSRAATQKFVKKLDEWKPDIINLHNLHGYYLNVEILFNYLKKVQVPIVWTFHDCWPFTGHCTHFDSVNCMKWKEECRECPLSRSYPASWFVDRSHVNFHKKKELFNGLNNMTIVTPSKWLADFIPDSFLGNYPVRVINNGINLEQFKPCFDENILSKYGIKKNTYILGVASVWHERKGLGDFIKLRSMFPKDIKIVLVGISPKIEKTLPSGIISVPRTESIYELAALYSSASVFVNPTYVDNFPTTNIEALACGTPVVTYRTGGSPESIDERTGIVVEKGDISGLKLAIEKVVRTEKPLYSSSCRERAENKYDKDDRYHEYIALFREMLNAT